MIGRVLNHSQPSATAVYARLDLEPVRRALEADAQTMLEVERSAAGSGRAARGRGRRGNSRSTVQEERPTATGASASSRPLVSQQEASTGGLNLR
jgi:hypothetical protein